MSAPEKAAAWKNSLAEKSRRLRKKIKSTWLVRKTLQGIGALRNSLNWRFVRGIGELQILTRASYVLLIAVPIMAAFWPSVLRIVETERLAIESADASLRNASLEVDDLLTQTRQLVNTSAGAVPDNRLQEVRADITRQIDRIDNVAAQVEAAASAYIDERRKKTAQDPQLPWTLAAAFFAALAVVIAHFIYQISVPEPVKNFSWDEFITKRMEEYSKHKSEPAKARAREFLDTKAGIRIDNENRAQDQIPLSATYALMEKGVPAKDALVDVPDVRVRWLLESLNSKSYNTNPKSRDRLKTYLQDYVDTFPAQGADESVFEMSLIERGARAEYLYRASRNVPMILTTMLIYITGIYLICLVIYVHALSVAQAAGINSVRELLFH